MFSLTFSKVKYDMRYEQNYTEEAYPYHHLNNVLIDLLKSQVRYEI